jgi:hypothetical protein
MKQRTISAIIALLTFLILCFGFVRLAHAATVCQIFNGCTGTSSLPAYGNVLIGGKNGEYEFVASSTLGGGGSGAVSSVFGRTGVVTAQTGDYTTTQVTEGTNLYFTTARANAAFVVSLAGTTSVASITTLPNLSLPYSQLSGAPNLNSYLTLAAWYATTTDQLSEGTRNLYFTNARAVTALTGQNISIFNNDANYLTASVFNTKFDNRLSATTSLPNISTLAGLSLPYSQLTGTPVIASSTLLGDSNTFSGNDTFNNVITGSVSGNAGTATKLGTARSINGVSFDGSSNITINAASSTLLSDANIFSGNTTFADPVLTTNGYIYGTAGFGGGEYLNLTNPVTLLNGNNGWGINLQSDYTRLVGGGEGKVDLQFSTDAGISRLSTGVLSLDGSTYQDGLGGFLAATSTVKNLTAITATTTALCFTGDICRTTWPTGSAFPFTPSANYNSTSTILGLLNGFFANASSTINAPLHLPSLSNGELAVNGGLVYSGATTTAGTGLSYSGGAFNVTGLTTAQFASANISQWTNNAGYLTSLAGAASSTLLTDANTFSGVNNFTNASSNFSGTWQTFAPSHFGTVTSIATNNGITGGTITTTGTIGLDISGLSTNALTAWNGSKLVATGTPQLTVGNLLATSTTATSTFAATTTAAQADTNNVALARPAAIFSTSTPGSGTVVFTGTRDSAPSFSAGTLTLPNNTEAIQVEIIGGGGGGGGGGNGANTGGGNGANSTFSTMTANSGSGGGNGLAGGSGGTVSGCDLGFTGGNGGVGLTDNSLGTGFNGGNGGASAFSGFGYGGQAGGSGKNALAGTGAGGGGGGTNGASTNNGSGGGAGG